MDTTPFPAMASLDRICEWIDANEQPLASHLLVHPQKGGACALLLSRVESGDYRLRLCEGEDERWLTWRDERRCRARFGRGYADSLLTASLATLQLAGYRVQWSAVAPELGSVGQLVSIAA